MDRYEQAMRGVVYSLIGIIIMVLIAVLTGCSHKIHSEIVRTDAKSLRTDSTAWNTHSGFSHYIYHDTVWKDSEWESVTDIVFDTAGPLMPSITIGPSGELEVRGGIARLSRHDKHRDTERQSASVDSTKSISVKSGISTHKRKKDRESSKEKKKEVTAGPLRIRHAALAVVLIAVSVIVYIAVRRRERWLPWIIGKIMR